MAKPHPWMIGLRRCQLTAGAVEGLQSTQLHRKKPELVQPQMPWPARMTGLTHGWVIPWQGWWWPQNQVAVSAVLELTGSQQGQSHQTGCMVARPPVPRPAWMEEELAVGWMVPRWMVRRDHPWAAGAVWLEASLQQEGQQPHRKEAVMVRLCLVVT